MILSVVGARPQFIKAAITSRALANAGLPELLVHTGQHYDARMSQIFFDELGLPAPAVNLGVGSGSHAAQTGAIMVALEQYLATLPRPRWMLVFGDTNSTLAAALVAAKLQIPLAHVEAGLRSFNRKMPEEINRIVTDRLSQLLFCPTETAVQHLHREGVHTGVHLCGDVMLEATLTFSERADRLAPLASLTPHAPGTYYLATVHRAENTDHPQRLQSIFEGLSRLGAPVLLPLHPRVRNRLAGRALPETITVLEPASYLSMLTLVRHARAVLTDSGGLQKEAYWLGVPCVTLREETEWVETLENGWNRLSSCDPDTIVAATRIPPNGPRGTFGQAGDENASTIIVRHLQTPGG